MRKFMPLQKRIASISVIFLVIVLSGLPSYGQDWKKVYDEAVNQYEAGKFIEALGQAKQAYALSKTLDARNQAYTAQLITAICLEASMPDDGLQFITEEESLFEKTEGIKSKPFADAHRKHAMFFEMKGAFRDAETKCEAALAACKESYGEDSEVFATLLAFYGQLAIINGNLSKAKEALNQAVMKLPSYPDAAEDYISTLTLSAELDKKLNDLASSEKKYRQLIALYETNNLQNSPDYGDAKSKLSEILISKGDKSESVQLLQSGAVSDEDKAQQYLKIAIDFQTQHDLEKAIGQYALAAKAVEEAKLENNTAFSIRLNYGRALLELEKSKEAEQQMSFAQDLCKKLYPPGSAEDAFLSFALGDLFISKNDRKAAGDYYRKAGDYSSTLAAPMRVRFLTNASRKLLNANQSMEAAALLKPAVTNFNSNEISEKDKSEALTTYCEALIQSNQNEEAIQQLNKAIESASDPEIRSRYTIELAEALRSSGEWSKALQLLTASNLSLPGEKWRAENFYQIARLQQQLGNYSEAEKSYRSSIELYRDLQPREPESLWQVNNSFAILYTQTGNYAEAERLYLDLLKQVDTFSGFHTTLQQNLASVYQETLRYDDAKKILESVVEQDRHRLGNHHPDFAVSLQNLAAVYQKTGQSEKAKELYVQALQIDKETLGETNLSYATKAANLGVVYQESGDLPKALQLLESALKICEAKLGKEHPDYVFNEYNLAVLYQRMNEMPKAYPLFQHVSSFYINQIRELFPAMSEKEKTAFYNKISEVILAYMDFAVENSSKQKELLGQLYNFRLATKALLLNASTKMRNRILSSGNVTLLQQFSEWLQAKEELGRLYSFGLEERELNKNQIQALQQKINELEKQLSAQSDWFARGSETETIDWRKVKEKLAPGEAAVEMIRLRLNLKNDSVIYAALVLKPELAEPALVIFPSGRQMEGREFSFYRNNIKFLQDNTRSYAVFWKPLETILKGTKTIYFSPDGVYNKVNILTLFNPEAGQYLIEQATIKLLSNIRELVTIPKPVAGQPKTAALFGFPNYKLGSTLNASALSSDAKRNINPTALSIINNGIPELPGTKDEVHKINELLKANQWSTNLYLAADASEEILKKQRPRVLHIATHGFFVTSSDGDEQVVLSRDLAQAANNPLLRSGLILSGAEKHLIESATVQNNKPTEDGILTAYEAINLSLDHTDLVVLSACETGEGEIRNGEGVYGLQRAFLLAGANNLLMSLWKVDDEATQQLMVEFYNQWNKTENKGNAFRNTELEMKKKFSHPYYWGSFVMVGYN